MVWGRIVNPGQIKHRVVNGQVLLNLEWDLMGRRRSPTYLLHLHPETYPRLLIAKEGEQICGLICSDPAKHIRDQRAVLVEDAQEPLSKRTVSVNKKLYKCHV